MIMTNKKKNMGIPAGQDINVQLLTDLKAKLKKKYHLLKDFNFDGYNLDTKDKMLADIGKALGFGAAEWEWKLKDL